MKNNCIVFACGLMMLSAQSFASRPALIENEPGQHSSVEGQPHIVPGGAPIFSSVSVGSSVKMYKDQETQTEITGHDEQVKAQLCHTISLKNIHQLTLNRVNNELQILQGYANNNQEEAIEALAQFNKLLHDDTYEVLVREEEGGLFSLKSRDLLQKSPGAGFWYRLKPAIIEAFKAEGLLKK